MSPGRGRPGNKPYRSGSGDFRSATRVRRTTWHRRVGRWHGPAASTSVDPTRSCVMSGATSYVALGAAGPPRQRVAVATFIGDRVVSMLRARPA